MPDEEKRRRVRTPSRLDPAILLDLVPAGLGIADPAGTVTYANRRWRQLLGFDGRFPLSPRGVARLVQTEDRSTLIGCFRSVRADGEAQCWLRTRHGPRIDLAIRRLPDGMSTRVGYIGVVTDVTELTEALDGVRRSEQRFRLLTSSLPVAAFRTDPAGAITWANDRLEEMSGYELEAMVGTSAFDVIHPEDREAAYIRALDAMAAGEPFESEHRFLCRDGSIRWMITRTTPVHDESGHVVEHVGTMEDVTHLHSRSAVLAHAAAHDHLTGLPNRASALALLEDLCARSRGRDDVGVVFVDLDDFKAINDTYGHHAGDAVLVEVADRLRRATRERDLVGRFAGDEFVVVCPDVGSPDVLRTVAARIRDLVGGEPVHVDGARIPTSASAGVALGPGRGSVGDLLRAADEAMYLDKRPR